MRVTAAVLWTAAVLVGLQKSASSPDNFVDRSSQNLSSVPTDLPQTTEFLDLSRNYIHQLHNGDFEKTTHLRFLNVSWNGLEEIDPQTFLDTPLLEHLDLSHNNLKNLSGQQYLLHTVNLLMLNLAFNRFLTMTLGSEFSSLVKLERLTVGAKNISVGDFKNIAKVKLRTLTLLLEDGLYYEAGSLEDVHAQRLQIAFGHNQKIDRNLTADALSLLVEVEMMNMKDGYKDLSKQLRETVKIHTTSFYLTNITIKWQDLTEYVNVALNTTLKHVGVSEIYVKNPPHYTTEVIKTSQVISFTARQAVVTSFQFSQEALYNFFISMPVERVAITDAPIIHMTCPKSQSPIRQLDFSFGALSDSIFSSVVGKKVVECQNLRNLKNLTLVGNSLKKLETLSKRFQYMSSLQHLDLSVNSIRYDQSLECIWPASITNINLSSNSLTDSVFQCLPNGTQILDLQNNQISVVPQSILKLRNLSTLNLNANRLRDLPLCDTFPSLHKLLLRSNSLHAPSVNILESCPELRTLDVSFNPFTCTCTLRSFIKLAINSEKNNSQSGIELLNWPQGYYCTYPEDVRNSTLRDISIPEVSCNIGLLVVAILVPAGTLIMFVVILCHCLDVPWYMGMIWQWTRAKHRVRMRQARPEDLVGLEFHAFVSYSQHDVDWVRNSLLPNLEGPAGGLRICHHEQHFVPGKTIIENIISCVEKCRRSVFVLSAHFVKSEWCHYELYFAAHQRLTLGSDSIVLVLLEPLPQYLIPSKYYQLKSMMNRHTYLEWPQDRAKQRLFWANLRAALQTDLPNAPVTQVQEHLAEERREDGHRLKG
ncbi:toll-like receptor 1 [Oreochromis niloticus]|uniref:Toll-like receptor 1 n=1 Tax=Oreochromis niloticus TaxID=8128 RepID=A0A669CIF8_ORENI|nr:toll-like receptor 1 [Oreochromis niloticus]